MKLYFGILAGLILLACGREQASPELNSTRGGPAKQEALQEQRKSKKSSKQSRVKRAGTQNAAKKLLEEFLNPATDTAALSLSLMPQTVDYKKVFIGLVATKAWTAYLPIFRGDRFEIKPGKGQTQLIMWSATTEELRSGRGHADKFPYGYRKISPHFQPGLRWYRFIFVRPNNTIGTAFDGLTYVNGRWIVFRKPWRLLKGARK